MIEELVARGDTGYKVLPLPSGGLRRVIVRPRTTGLRVELYVASGRDLHPIWELLMTRTADIDTIRVAYGEAGWSATEPGHDADTARGPGSYSTPDNR